MRRQRKAVTENEASMKEFRVRCLCLQAINRKLADGSHGDVSEMLRQMTISTECEVLQVGPGGTQGGKGWGCSAWCSMVTGARRRRRRGGAGIDPQVQGAEGGVMHVREG